MTTPIGSGSSDDLGNAVAVTNVGKAVVVGATDTDPGAGANYDFAVARYNEDGTLDTTFGGDGIVTVPIGPGSNQDIADAVAIQDDQKIVVAGRAFMGIPGTGYDFGVIRLNTDGTLDTGFDGDGIATTAIASGIGDDSPHAVAIQSDGQIVVAGSSNGDFSLARYGGGNGALDPSFDGPGGSGDGRFSTDFGDIDTLYDIAINSVSNQIVAAGETLNGTDTDFALARYNVSDGSLDPAFDGPGSGNGKFATDFGSDEAANAVAIQPDNKIVVAGYTATGGDLDFALARYSDTDGSLDTTFDGDGGSGNGKFATEMSVASGLDLATGVAIERSGGPNSGPGMTIVAGGYADGGAGGTDFAAARYAIADGKLDTTFSGDGKATVPIASGNAQDLANGMAVDAQNRIVLAGQAPGGATGNDFAVARLDAAQLFNVNDSQDIPDADTSDNRCDQDGFNGGDQCTLRAAIAQANATTGRDTVGFDTGVAALGSAPTIGIDSSLPTLSQAAVVDGCSAAPASIQPCVGLRANAGVPSFNGIGVTTENVDVAGIAFTNLNQGIFYGSGNNGLNVRSSWFGLKLNGTTQEPNEIGISVVGNAATIGGTTAADRNVFADNSDQGIQVFADADTTAIRGNYFGTMPDGTTPAAGNGDDIEVVGNGTDTPSNTRIGGTLTSGEAATTVCDGACNVISNAQPGNGIDLQGEGGGESPAGALIQSNFIGLDKNGTADLGNAQNGIRVGQASDAYIGVAAGPAAAERNYIGGNQAAGISSAGATGLNVESNFLGLGSDGTTAVPDSSAAADLISPAGGPLVFRGNRVAGSGGNFPDVGLRLRGQNAQVLGNTFGLSTTNAARPIRCAAIEVQGTGNTIGGTDGSAANVVANATDTPTGCPTGPAAGILIRDPLGPAADADGGDQGGDQNVVTWNYVGTLSNETTGVGNQGPGLRIAGDADRNRIGGNDTFEENRISFNGGDAVEVTSADATRNQILRNRGTGNGGQFIDLGADGPGNSLSVNSGAPAPAISLAAPSFVRGSATPGTTVRVFAKSSASPGELQVAGPTFTPFLGQVTANGSGVWQLNYDQQNTFLTLPLTNGQRVVASRTDALGDTSELSAVKQTDGDPPETIMTSAPGKTTRDRTPTFRFTSDEPAGDTFRCKLDQRPFTSCKSPKTYATLAFGAHLFKVKATDKAGNADQSAARKRFKIVH